MAAKIFINYRRDDSAGHAGRVQDRLKSEFAHDLLFLDVDAIPLGVNFVKEIQKAVADCDVLLALIGSDWLEARDTAGQRRLDDPRDFVRIEIATALQRSIPVIPILLEGTRMPKAEQLPEDIRELSLRNGLDVRHSSFHADMDKLIRALKGFGKTGVAPTAQRSAVDVTRADPEMPSWSIAVELGPPVRRGTKHVTLGAGKVEWFKDAAESPDMVVVPSGEFLMGSSDEQGRDGREGPQHPVTILTPFAVGRFAVTVSEYAAFVEAAGHPVPDKMFTLEDDIWEERSSRSFRYPGFPQTPMHPVVGVSWDDAKAYSAWLSQETGQPYRLLSEAEWEFVARAGSSTPFWWGSSISTTQANYNGNTTYGGGATGEWRKKTVAVDSFEPNPWGLFQVHGNVWEWCEDCWNPSYRGAPNDGTARMTGACGSRVVRGGSWFYAPRFLRSAFRDGASIGTRYSGVGVRVARTL
jgi:formylglycine-generating enzyme required for sulfatase activity